MEATFFCARTDDALGVRCVDDLPGEPAADPLRLDSPAGLTSLVALLGATATADSEPAISQLRDTTCQSFPVWRLSRALTETLEKLSDAEIESVAERWLADPVNAGMDTDLYEASSALEALRDAIAASTPNEHLFVLLEEKAL